MSGPSALFENPQYATPVGLIRYAQLLNDHRPQVGDIVEVGPEIWKNSGSQQVSRPRIQRKLPTSTNCQPYQT